MVSFLKRSLAFSLVMLSSIGLIGVAGPSHAFTPSCTLLPARNSVVNGEVFLGGDFIELGLSAKGSFGTSESAPAGFRGNDSESNLGMGADLDGYCATPSDNTDLPIDFFTPGNAEERWSVGFTISGAEHFGSFSELEDDDSSAGITATHTVTDESSGSNLSAKVVSVVSLNGVQTLRVTATHRFAKSEAFFRTAVVFENLSGSPLTDVRYHRSFDPDNAKFQLGDFETRQTILDTVADGGTSVVQAKLSATDSAALSTSGKILNELSATSGITTEIPIIYYSSEPESVAYFGGFVNPNPYEPLYRELSDNTDFFDSPQSLNATVEDDSGIGIIVRTLSLASGATSSRLNFITSLDSRDFSELAEVLEEASDEEASYDASSDEEPSAPRAPVLPRLDNFNIETGENGQPQLRIEGKRLWCISSMTVDGMDIPFTSGFSTPWYEYLNADLSGVTPGKKTLVVQSCMGKVTYTNWLTIPSPVEPKSMWTKVSSFGLSEAAKAKIAAFNSTLGDGYTKIRCIVNSANGDDMNEALVAQVCTFANSNDASDAIAVLETRDSFAGSGYWINIWVSGN
jgi:hypothetical protein